MSKTVKISDDLASAIEKRRTEEGFASLDAAAETLIARGLIGSPSDHEEMDPAEIEELRALIAEADAEGEEIDWDPAAGRAEVRRRYAEQSRKR